MNSNMLCSKCKKRLAVVFMSRIDGDNSTSEGLCIKCAKEKGITAVTDMLDKMGITDAELDIMDEQLLAFTESMDGENFDMGGAQQLPFLQSFFGNIPIKKIDDQQDEDIEDDSEISEDANFLTFSEDDIESTQKPEISQQNSREKNAKEKEKKKYKFINAHCENLTQKSKDGKIDNIIGREKEIGRVIQILNRRTKNNPCLIGEPGVGKTAIAEGIATRLAIGEVPASLRDKELYLLDMTSLVAGTQFRGQFESRVKGLIEDVRKIGNAILFIDEVHSLVGAGDSEGSMNAANILKPALSRGEIQVIGATTFDEYRKHIEKDAALERRFQPVKVDQPSVSDAISVINGIKQYYEKFHRVEVSNDIARKTVILSERYINDRFLPDKAIDLLDEACSCANLKNKDLAKYDECNRELVNYRSIVEKEEQKEKDINYEMIAETKSKIFQTEVQIRELEPRALGMKVTDDDLAKVIELWTGIPASKIKDSELRRVADLDESLKKKIIGQEEAVDKVAAAVRRSRVQINKKRRPASFIFVGPTGVGKTELAKVLSDELFDTQNPLIRLDMSEFMEKHSVARIIGAPPGYIGYDEAGQLTEKVRRRPYSVILLDEIEKSHPDVMNILLQILDEGKISDAQGRVVSFESTVIIMTSNAGSEGRSAPLGFNKASKEVDKEKAMKSLAEFLRPEFLGRVDEIVVFSSLTRGDFEKIAALQLDELKEPLQDKGIDFSFDDDSLKVIAEKSYGQKGGARDLRKTIRKEVEDVICTTLVKHADDPPTVIRLARDGNSLKVFTM